MTDERADQGLGRRYKMQRHWRILAIGITAVLSAACSGAPSSVAPSEAQATARPTGALITAAPTPAGGRTSDGKILIRWFVGLGTGGNPEQLGAEQAAVAKC